MIQTNGSHAVTNVSITKQHGMCCHFFHLVFQKGLSCFHFTGGKCSERPTYRGCRRVAKEGEIEGKSLWDSTERCSWFLTSFRCLTVTLQDIVNFQNLSLLCGTSKSSSTLLQKFVCVFFLIEHRPSGSFQVLEMHSLPFCSPLWSADLWYTVIVYEAEAELNTCKNN